MSPTRVDPVPWTEYADAMWVWTDHERSRSTPEDLAYWRGRLAATARAADTGVWWSAADDTDTVVGEPTVVRLDDMVLRRQLFPAVLHSAAVAARVLWSRPAALAYTWGGRPYGVGDLVGCFMNTLLCGNEPRDRDGPLDWPDFVDGYWQDLDHAATPFEDQIGSVNAQLRTGWSGNPDLMVVFEDQRERPSPGRDPSAVSRWTPPRARAKAPLGITAVLRDDDALELRTAHAAGVDAAAARHLLAELTGSLAKGRTA